MQNRENIFTGIFNLQLTKGTILNKYVYFSNHKFYAYIILKCISIPADKNQSYSPLSTEKNAFLILKIYPNDNQGQ